MNPNQRRAIAALRWIGRWRSRRSRLAEASRQPNSRAAMLAVAVLAAAVTAAAMSYSVSRRHAIESLQGNVESRISLLSSRLFAPADKYSYLPKIVSNNPLIAEAFLHSGDPRRIRAANDLLERLNASAGSSTIYLLNPEGLTIASSNWRDKLSFVGNNYGFRPYFLDALRKGEGRFYAMGVTTGKPGYFISALVKRGDRPLGVIAVKTDILELDPRWKENDDEAMVTDDHGVIFLSSRTGWQYRPLWPLAASALEQLQRTRQYEGVLKAPLSVKVKETLPDGAKIIAIAREPAHWYGHDWDTYFVRSRTLPDSEWAVHILTPMAQIKAQAWRAAGLTVGATALLVLLLLYLNQVRIRLREREESRLMLEEAHEALAQKHADLQALSEELRVKSMTDPLTGIFNRRFFLEAASRMIEAARRHRYPLSIMMIDVDHFKRINDVHGHPAGDAVLHALATLYGKEMRESDILARYGGEEFVIALSHTRAEAAHVVAERLRVKVMEHSFAVDGGALRATISCGISEYRPYDNSIDAAIKRADDALYAAKKAGRNCVVISQA